MNLEMLFDLLDSATKTILGTIVSLAASLLLSGVHYYWAKTKDAKDLFADLPIEICAMMSHALLWVTAIIFCLFIMRTIYTLLKAYQ